MTQKTLHAKIASIDGVFASLGSYNLDHWSARRNLEVNISIIDHHLAGSLKEQFMKDLELSKEIKPKRFFNRSFIARFISWLSYLLLRL
jgi:cardiolipin synthase